MPIFRPLAVAVLVLAACGEPFDPDPIRPPLVVTAEAMSRHDVQLSWQPPRNGGADHYTVHRATDMEGPWFEAGASEELAFLDGGLDAGTLYWYRMRSCTAGGLCSEPSTLASAETLPPPPPLPSVPEDLSVDRVEEDYIDLSWTGSSADTHHIERREDGGAWAPVGETSESFLRDEAVQPGPLYGYRARACNDVGCSDFTPEVQARIGVPAPPAGFELEAFTMRESWLFWEKPPGRVDDYPIERSVDGGPWEEVFRMWRENYGDEDVVEGATYRYRVRACNEVGCSEPTSAVERTMPVVPRVEGRMVVVGGYQMGDTMNESSLRIVDNVNDPESVRRVHTVWRQSDVQVVGEDLWIFSSAGDLVRLDLPTGDLSTLAGYDQLLETTGLAEIGFVSGPGRSGLMLAARPGGGVILSAGYQEDGTWGAAVLDASLSAMEAFLPFVPRTGAAVEVDGEETWYLLGTRTREPGEAIELMIVPGGRLAQAWHVPLGSFHAPPPASSASGQGGAASAGGASAGGGGTERLAVDGRGVAWVVDERTLHRIALDGSHQRIDLPQWEAARVVLSGEHAYVMMDGALLRYARIYRIALDGSGPLELFAEAEDDRWYLRSGFFHDLEMGPDGKRLYVVAGTPPVVNATIWTQELQVYVFDTATGELVERTRLGGYSMSPRIRSW